jgi:glucuronosyltransferase
MEKTVFSLGALVALCFLFIPCFSERILFLTPVGSKSHKFAFMPIAEELASRGHQVTVVSPYKASKNITNLREIQLMKVAKLFEEVEIDWFIMSKQSPMVQSTTMLSHIRTVITEGYDDFAHNLEVKEILEKKNVDLVVLDAIFNDFVSFFKLFLFFRKCCVLS